MTTSTSKERSPVKLSVFVVIAAALLSCFLGMIAAVIYGGFDASEGRDSNSAQLAEFMLRVGAGWGGTTGLLAGILWCRKMYGRSREGKRDGLVGYGTAMGVVFGLLATVLLHVGLFLSSPDHDAAALAIGLAIGLLCAAASGAVLGVFSAAIWNRLERESERRETAGADMASGRP